MSNVISFTGTLGRDAEIRNTPDGNTVLQFTVANNNGFGDKKTTIWFRVSLWGKRAEGPLKNYLKKGQQVFISGEFRHHEYQGQDGTTKTSLEVNANIVDLVGKKQEGAAQESNSQEKPQTYSHDGFDDDIPFN